MLTLATVKDWIKKTCKLDTAYIGRIDAKKTNCVGVYNLKSADSKRRLMGPQRYDVQGVSLLVHGSASKSDTEDFAQRIYDALDGVKDATIGGKKVIDLQLSNNRPIDIDYDGNNIYEYAIEFLLIMEV